MRDAQGTCPIGQLLANGERAPTGPKSEPALAATRQGAHRAAVTALEREQS